jgi:hypothetical protein
MSEPMSLLPIAFLLMISPQETPSAEAADPVICKRFVETGSLVRKRRVCRTRSAWNKEASSLRDSTTRFVDDRRGRVRSPN